MNNCFSMAEKILHIDVFNLFGRQSDKESRENTSTHRDLPFTGVLPIGRDEPGRDQESRTPAKSPVGVEATSTWRHNPLLPSALARSCIGSE